MKYIFFCFLRYVGRLFVMGSRKPVDILMKLNEMAGFAPDEEIDLFEVSQSLHLIYKYLPIP
jgi:ubiquitin carboxyl-terminal hydrolase 7